LKSTTMTKVRLVRWSLIPLVGLVAACDQGPTAPSRAPIPSPSGTAVATRLGVTGPDVVAPGKRARLTATAYLSDGSTRHVTSEATWSSSSANVVSMIAPGEISAGARGEATIRVSYREQAGRRLVFVMPLGTYRLTGNVMEAGLAVNGARVEILGGAGEGLSAMTGGGVYRIYGVAGDTRVRVSKQHYEPAVQLIDVSEHRTLDFELKRSR